MTIYVQIFKNVCFANRITGLDILALLRLWESGHWTAHTVLAWQRRSRHSVSYHRETAEGSFEPTLRFAAVQLMSDLSGIDLADNAIMEGST